VHSHYDSQIDTDVERPQCCLQAPTIRAIWRRRKRKEKKKKKRKNGVVSYQECFGASNTDEAGIGATGVLLVSINTV